MVIHPLVQAKLAALRDRESGTGAFRGALALQRDFQRQPEMLAPDVLESLLADAPEPELPEVETAIRTGIRKCIERLAPAAREIIRMRYFGQHGPSEIARIRNSSVNAINVTLARARDALRRCIEIQTLSS